LLNDIVDTGKTLERYRKFPYLKIALYTKSKRTTIMPDIFIRDFNENEWIVLPYENEMIDAKTEYDAHLEKTNNAR